MSSARSALNDWVIVLPDFYLLRRRVVRCLRPHVYHTMNDISPPQRETPDSLMLYGFWYRALPSGQVSGNKLRKAMLLETPLAIGRDRQGRPFRPA